MTCVNPVAVVYGETSTTSGDHHHDSKLFLHNHEASGFSDDFDKKAAADAETQTLNVEVGAHSVETQTDEFDYLFKETIVQPFTE